MSVDYFKVNTFDNFFKQSGVSANAIYTPKSQPQQPVLEAQSDSFVHKGNSKIRKKKLFGIIGVSVSSVALLTLILLFTLSKGFSAGFAKKFSKISADIKSTIADLTNKSDSLTPLQNLKLQVTKKIQPVAEYLEASANVTAVKDSAMNKLLHKMSLGNYVNAINKFFKDKIVLTTKNNSYKKAEISVVEYCNYLERIAKKDNNPDLQELIKKIMTTYTDAFSVKSHVSRTERNWEKLDGLGNEVFDVLFKYQGTPSEKLKQFKSNFKTLKSYVTISLTEPQRVILKEELTNSQNKLCQNMMSALKYVPQEKKELAERLLFKADKNIDKAVSSEIKAFNKLAEIRVGSVSTDILGIIVPTALATGLIINSENKNERIGTTLTKGIPIFGGLGVSYYGSTRGFTGVKNIALGLSTAFVLNMLGSSANDSYKKYSENQMLLKKTFDSFNKLQTKVSNT